MKTAGNKGAKGRDGGGTQDVNAVDDTAADALFQILLAEFTAARNALVARLKKAGRNADAHAVKSLVKPSASAWAVNQLYWQDREAFDRLLAAGNRFRRAQAAHLAGQAADIRGPLEERREALAALSKLAAAKLQEAGHAATPDTLRRVASTLEAISATGGTGLPLGRLVDDVDPPGFETLAALVPRTGESDLPSGPSRVLTFHQKAKPPAKKLSPEERQRRADEERTAVLAAATAAVKAAERELWSARAAAEKAEAALKKAAALSKDAERARQDAEAALERAAAESDQARQRARLTAVAAEDAAQAVTDAERTLDKAQQEVGRLVP